MADRPPILKSIFGNGWTPAKKAVLTDVVLPEKTRCWQCSKLKATSHQNYSEKKLQELRSAIAHGQAARNPTGKWIVCRSCVGGQVAELECTQCNEWKGLKDFTKAQRKDPDRARCTECVADCLDEDPIHGDADWDRKHNEDDDSGDDTTNYHEDSEFASESSGGGARLSEHDQDDLTNENLHVLNVCTGGQRIKQSASLASTSASIADTVRNPSQASTAGVDNWQKMAGRGPLGAAAGNAFVGYDDQGQAHPQFRAPSTTGSDSDRSTATTTAENHNARAEPLNRSKFAKVKGTKGKPAVYRPKRTDTRTVTLNDYDDDDDDDDNEGDDYFTY